MKRVLLVLLVTALVLVTPLVLPTGNLCAAAAGPPVTYQLSRIEVTTNYPTGWTTGTVEPGSRSLGPGERTFRMGWTFTFESGMSEFNYEGKGHAGAVVTLTQVPTTLVSGTPATLAASLTGEWKNQGYGVDRDHTIGLSGAAGEKTLSVPSPPSSSCNGAIDTSNTITVPDSAGTELPFTVQARLNFGGDNWSDMTVRLVYQLTDANSAVPGVEIPAEPTVDDSTQPSSGNPTQPTIYTNGTASVEQLSTNVQNLLDDIKNQAANVGSPNGMTQAEFQQYLLDMQTRLDGVKRLMDSVERAIQNFSRQ